MAGRSISSRVKPPVTSPAVARAVHHERDREAAVSRILRELHPSDQLLLRLRFEEGLTAREIAPLLGLPSQFHVYRRIETVCGMVRARLTRDSGHGGTREAARAAVRRGGCR